MMEEFLNYTIAPGPLTVHEIRTLPGANYFSWGSVIVFRLDLGEYDEVFTDEIPGIYEKLTTTIPSMHDHKCSVGEPGGFFKRVKDGTLLGHLTEHVVIELQTMAGMDVAFGKTRATSIPGVYNVVFRFFDEIAGIYAGKAGVNLINAWLENQPFDIQPIIDNLITIREQRVLGPSTQAIVNEAQERQIPRLRLDKYNLVQLGTGKYQKRIRATVTSDTNLIAVETSDDKQLSAMLFHEAGIPVPETIVTNSVEDVLKFQQQINAPVALEPNAPSSAKGLSIGLTTENQIRHAFVWASKYNSNVVAQAYRPTSYYRLLVIDYQFVAAVQLTLPKVVGDGRSTITQLIDDFNRMPGREIGDKALLSKIEIDETTQQLLENQDYTLNMVLPRGKEFFLKASGSLREGGTACDVTDLVHPLNRFFAERACQVLGLNVGGVDVMTSDITTSLLDNQGVVRKVTAAPDFRMHLQPTEGKSRNIAHPFLDLLFPDPEKTHIPVFSVTGTKGKTTTVNLLAHCLNQESYQIGLVSSEGLFLNGRCIKPYDATASENASLVLKDPTIDCAIFETPLESILHSGLGYEFADFGIVLNIYEEPLDNEDVRLDDLEDVSYAKSVVSEEIYSDGFAILNADQPLVVEMQDRLHSRYIWFSESANNEWVKEHVGKGGRAVVLDKEQIKIFHDSDKILCLSIRDIPLLKSSPEALGSVLACIAALYAFGLPLALIEEGLKSF